MIKGKTVLLSTVLSLVAVVVLVIILAVVSQRDSSTDPSDFAETYQQLSWEQVERIASGQEVYWHMWGGSDDINAYVDDYIAKRLLAEYNVTLRRIPLTDTADVINKLQADKLVGNTDDGSVDLVWINGENYRALRQASLLFGPYSHLLPNRRFIHEESPALRYDFGYPVEDFESPYGSAQFVVLYNSEHIPNPPRNIPMFIQWIKDNPGTFTYPLLPDFVGSAFVRHIFYHHAGTLDALMEGFDEELYMSIAEKTWGTLNEIKPYLWREGETYPESQSALELLYANGEVWIDMSYNPSKGGQFVQSGQYPASTRTLIFDEGTISNHHYVAIPYNSPHKAAAIVLANLLLDPEAQIIKNDPAVWGDGTVLSLSKLSQDQAARLQEIQNHPSSASSEMLSNSGLPELPSVWLEKIEQEWVTNILTQ